MSPILNSAGDSSGAKTCYIISKMLLKASSIQMWSVILRWGKKLFIYIYISTQKHLRFRKLFI